MQIGETIYRLPAQATHDFPRQLVEHFGARTVLNLQAITQQHRLLNMRCRQRAFPTVRSILRTHQRMRHEVDELIGIGLLMFQRNLRVNIGDHFVHVAAQPVDLGKLHFRHVGNGDVNVATVFGKGGGHLGADEYIRQTPVKHLSHAVYRVVVGQRDQ